MKSYALALLLLIVQATAAGQALTQKADWAVLIDTPIRIDGVLDEPAWEQAAVISEFLLPENPPCVPDTPVLPESHAGCSGTLPAVPKQSRSEIRDKSRRLSG
jgi:hypothetical protein